MDVNTLERGKKKDRITILFYVIVVTTHGVISILPEGEIKLLIGVS